MLATLSTVLGLAVLVTLRTVESALPMILALSIWAFALDDRVWRSEGSGRPVPPPPGAFGSP
jgi:hypothetical protein